MDKEKLVKILDDIYAVDPSLQKDEEKLIVIISELASLKPDVKMNAEFLAGLKERLYAAARRKPEAAPYFSWFLPGAFGAAALAFAIVVFFGFSNMPGRQDRNIWSGQTRIIKAGQNAFGQLALSRPSGGKGGGGGSSLSAPGASGVSSMPVAPMAFKYIYKGGKFNLPKGDLSVFKRVTGNMNTDSLASVFRGFNLGIIDLGSFPDAKLDNFTLTEDEASGGYSISVNAKEESVSINDIYMYERLYKNCDGKLCTGNEIKLSDIPSDPELISAANSFLLKHGINTAGYGEPVVPKQWLAPSYAASSGPADAGGQVYIPEVVSVIYPLIINGETVHDALGDGWGLVLSVNINVREKSVSAVYMKTNVYQESGYPALTDESAILKAAENGGLASFESYFPENAPVKEIGLDTPKQVLARVWNIGEDGKSEELIVHALEFPVITPPVGYQYYGYNRIVVPLVGGISRSGGVRIMGK